MGGMRHHVGHHLGHHVEPLRTLRQVLGQRRLRVGLTGEALHAQMPEGFRPLDPCLLRFARQCRAGSLLALGGSYYHPALTTGSARHRRPAERSLLLPVLFVGLPDCLLRLRRGLRNPADPAHLSQPRQVLHAVHSAIRHENRRCSLRSLRSLRFLPPQLLPQRLHRRHQGPFIARLPIQRLQIERDVALARGG
jgi:hypothetical protein